MLQIRLRPTPTMKGLTITNVQTIRSVTGSELVQLTDIAKVQLGLPFKLIHLPSKPIRQRLKLIHQLFKLTRHQLLKLIHHELFKLTHQRLKLIRQLFKPTHQPLKLIRRLFKLILFLQVRRQLTTLIMKDQMVTDARVIGSVMASEPVQLMDIVKVQLGQPLQLQVPRQLTTLIMKDQMVTDAQMICNVMASEPVQLMDIVKVQLGQLLL